MSIETPAALFALSDFAEHTDGSGMAWEAFQEVDAHITALHAEVARLQARERELRELLAVVNGDGGHHAQAVGTGQAVEDAIATYHALQARVRELEAALTGDAR